MSAMDLERDVEHPEQSHLKITHGGLCFSAGNSQSEYASGHYTLSRRRDFAKVFDTATQSASRNAGSQPDLSRDYSNFPVVVLQFCREWINMQEWNFIDVDDARDRRTAASLFHGLLKEIKLQQQISDREQSRTQLENGASRLIHNFGHAELDFVKLVQTVLATESVESASTVHEQVGPGPAASDVVCASVALFGQPADDRENRLSIATRAVLEEKLAYKTAASLYQVSVGAIHRRIGKTAAPARPEKTLQPAARNPLLLACDAVRTGAMTLRKAASTFEVKKSTIDYHLKKANVKKVGAKFKFTVEQEDAIADLLLSCAEMGVPLNKSILRKVVIDMQRTQGVGKDEIGFSDKWHRAFLARHPLISERITYASSREKVKRWTQELAEKWIAKLQILADRGYLSEDSGLWNLDESAFHMAEIYDVVYAARGTKEVASLYDGDPKERLTVLPAGNAAGLLCRPLVLYDGAVHLASRVEGTDNMCVIGVNKSGWMDREIFALYVEQEIIPLMTAKKNVIFFDKHWSHLSVRLLRVCQSSGKDIQLVCLPSGQTSRLQPWDKCVYGGVKAKWRQHLRSLHTAVMADPLGRNNFPRHLMELWPEMNLSETLIDGFGQTGIYPFDPKVIRATVCPVASVTSVDKMLAVDPYSPQKRQIRQALSNMNIPASFHASLVDQADRLSKGVSPGMVSAIDLCSVLRRDGLEEKPKRKSDMRLESSSGIFVTSNDAEKAMRQQEAKAASKLIFSAEKKAKQASRTTLTNGKRSAPKEPSGGMDITTVQPAKKRGRPCKLQADAVHVYSAEAGC